MLTQVIQVEKRIMQENNAGKKHTCFTSSAFAITYYLSETPLSQKLRDLSSEEAVSHVVYYQQLPVTIDSLPSKVLC